MVEKRFLRRGGVLQGRQGCAKQGRKEELYREQHEEKNDDMRDLSVVLCGESVK